MLRIDKISFGNNQQINNPTIQQPHNPTTHPLTDNRNNRSMKWNNCETIGANRSDTATAVTHLSFAVVLMALPSAC